MKFQRVFLAVAAAVASTVFAQHPDKEHRSLELRDTNRYVFAHLIVGIVSNRASSADWDGDMQRAKAVGIDAFALNIGTDSFTDQQLGYAYTSAQNNGMKVFLSFDFAYWSTGNGAAIGQKIAQYASQSAQLMVDGKVFVSSFVGDGVDVDAVRNAAGVEIYFAPNFHPGQGTSLADVNSAFNWMGWPNNGDNRAPTADQNVTVADGDQQYISALGGKDYMAPASPWFFTHYGPEVSYSKNWLFPGDTLWFDRWTQLLSLKPRFVEIVTWNDYGESHYVGPLGSPHTDDGASKWVNDMPHDGWLTMSKPYIAAFKAGASSVDNYITSDELIYWYRPQAKTVDCDATDTCMTGTAGGNYYIGRPNGYETVSDSVFVVSLLKSAGSVRVTSGNDTHTFDAPAGANIYTVPMGVGQQTFALSRDGECVLSGTSLKDIINGCVCGLYNFNAYVGTLPAEEESGLAPAGLAQFSNGLRVSTCSATPSLTGIVVSATCSASASSTTTSVSATTTATTTTGPAISGSTTESASTSTLSTTGPSSSSGLTSTSLSLSAPSTTKQIISTTSDSTSVRTPDPTSIATTSTSTSVKPSESSSPPSSSDSISVKTPQPTSIATTSDSSSSRTPEPSSKPTDTSSTITVTVTSLHTVCPCETEL